MHRTISTRAIIGSARRRDSSSTQISQQGQGYIWTPGIYTEAQVAGWTKVTEAVHQAGGRIFIQLWHVGRVSHVSLQPGGGQPVAPSAIAAKTKTFIETGFADPPNSVP
jgi:N-ethylmaleimide reductase